MSLDYRALLGKVEELTLPWLQGDAVDARERRLRLRARPAAPGWWRFRVDGRWASPLAPAEPEPELLQGLERASGHLVGGRLVLAGGAVEPVWLLPEEEPPRFAPCRARRWWSGELLFEELPFEGEAEEAVRRAFEDGLALEGVVGVPATLRAAFGLTLVEAAARAQGARVAPLEVRQRLGEVAEGGPALAAEVVRALLAERARATAEREAARRAAEAARLEEQRLSERREVVERQRGRGPARRRDPRGGSDPRERVEEALRGAGAALLDLRRLGGDQLEVRWRFLGERFVSLVEAGSLRVIDAGICLSGTDAEVNLASLPGVVREGAERGLLVMTRHDEYD